MSELQTEYSKLSPRARENKIANSTRWNQKNKDRHKEILAKYVAENPDKIRATRLKYKSKSTKKTMLSSAKCRAKRLGIPFSLTEDDISIPEVCPILGIKLEANVGKGRPAQGSPSLDRIRPELGYVVGNIIVISNKANMIKSNATSEEILKVGEYYKKLGI